MQAAIKLVVCPVRYCGRLVSAALPLHTRSSHHFDTKTFCSQRCAKLHSRDEHRTPSGPLITCDVCIEDKPLADYIYSIKENGVHTGQWSIPIPSGCRPHLAPELLDLESGVCADCLRSHILTQFENRGAVNVSCVHSHTPDPDRISDVHTILSQGWLPYAHHFLPSDRHDAYFQQLFDHYIYSTNTTLWVCPSDCGYSNDILQPNGTPGYPHVECPGCRSHFCANCKVTWHTDQTCQQYRATHPEVRDEDEVKQLRELARLGARRCPRCQFIIIKDGGCDHVFCERCHFDFNWLYAELVVVPIEPYVPAFIPTPTASASAPTFRGWGQLRRTQEEYITHNNINDVPFNIGNSNSSNKATPQDKGIIFYDLDLDFWTPEPCELTAIASRQAGTRLIRHPSHDRDQLWAFIEVDRNHEGGMELQEALRHEAEQMWRGAPEGWGDDLPGQCSSKAVQRTLPFPKCPPSRLSIV